MRTIRGMVVVDGCTYRIECSRPSHYEIVRIWDDARIGAFVTLPRFEVVEAPLGAAIMRAIARVAMRNGKTSWADALSLTATLHARADRAALKPRKA